MITDTKKSLYEATARKSELASQFHDELDEHEKNLSSTLQVGFDEKLHVFLKKTGGNIIYMTSAEAIALLNWLKDRGVLIAKIEHDPK